MALIFPRYIPVWSANTTISWSQASISLASNRSNRTGFGGDCAALSVRIVRRVSTVSGSHWLVDFNESTTTSKLRAVDRSGRSVAWFKFDPLLCSQRAKGAAPALVAG